MRVMRASPRADESFEFTPAVTYRPLSSRSRKVSPRAAKLQNLPHLHFSLWSYNPPTSLKCPQFYSASLDLHLHTGDVHVSDIFYSFSPYPLLEGVEKSAPAQPGWKWKRYFTWNFAIMRQRRINWISLNKSPLFSHFACLLSSSGCI